MYVTSFGVSPLICIILYWDSIIFKKKGAFWTPVEKEFINDCCQLISMTFNRIPATSLPGRVGGGGYYGL